MVKFLSTILCRFFGRACEIDYPATKEIVNRLEKTTIKVEEGTMAIRRLRNAGEYALLHDRIAARERMTSNGA